MARASSVDYEQVAAACSRLFLDGRATSFESVYELIDRKGSAKVVQNFIAAWRREMAERFVAGRTNPDLPEGLVEESDRLVAAVWKSALTKADDAYAGERETLEQTRLEMEQHVAMAQDRAAEFEKETIGLQERVRAQEGLIQERDAFLATLQQQLAETTTEIRLKTEEAARLREEVVRLNAVLEGERVAAFATLSAERERHEAALQSETQRHEAALEAERTRAHEAIEREREIAAGERRHLMVQTDEIRQAAKANETVLREQLAEARAMSEAFREKAGRAEGAIEYQRGRAEAAEELGRKTELTIHELRGEIVAMKTAESQSGMPDGSAGREKTE